MLFRDVIDLITVAYTEDTAGDFVETDTVDDYTLDGTEFEWDVPIPWAQVEIDTVFCNKKSIRQSEFYQAQATGLRPELMFVVRTIDYNNQDKIIYNDKKYNVIRVFDKNGEFTELICKGLVGTEVR